jgi:hypothetical protein
VAEGTDTEVEQLLNPLAGTNRKASDRFPWYDSWWLAEYVDAKEALARELPELVAAFDDSHSIFRTSPDFETQALPALLGTGQLDEIRSEIARIDDASAEQHETEPFGRVLVHNHAYFDAMHESFVELVSTFVGEPVEPSYNFLSLYKANAKCDLHLDALDAKWTLDICIEQSDVWPIYISNVVPWPEDFEVHDEWQRTILDAPHVTFRSYDMEPGDALLFSGSSQWHYRARQPGGPHRYCNLVFFHFVPKGTRNVRPSDWGPLALELDEPELSEPSTSQPVIPRPDPRGFRRELTPTWLASATLLNRHLPPDLSRPFRAAYLGCGTGLTPSVVAAVHPESEIWAWDFRAGQLEATRRLRDAAELDNLLIHERVGLPPDLGGRVCDVIVVAGVLDTVCDELRSEVLEAVSTNLRPGGLLCVTYRTTVGWVDVVPMQRLMRYLFHLDLGDRDRRVDRLLDVLAELQEGAAGYSANRAVVAEWLAAEVFANDPATVATEYLDDEMRPLSHAQLVEWLEPSGCAYVGSARLTDDLDLEVNDTLKEMIDGAPSSLVREAYRDLAVRRTTRADIFRLGEAWLAPGDHNEMLASLKVIGTAPAERDQATLRMMFHDGRAHPASASPAVPFHGVDALSAIAGIHVSAERGSAQ